MIRRVHVEKLTVGPIALPPAEAHHVRDVLRLTVGTTLELFDDSGAVATGPITHISSGNVMVMIESIAITVHSAVMMTVAAAVPKGDRADWMVEKLSELGVARFIPLITERSVVLPAGKNKIERWERIAIEASKQSRRSGVMTIAPLTSLDDVIRSVGSVDAGSEVLRRAGSLRRDDTNPALRSTSETGVGFQTRGWYLSIDADALHVDHAKISANQILLIGPEGGWTDAETSQMKSAGLQGVGLTSTVLRVETAAVIAAGVVLCLTATRSPSSSD